MGTHSEVQRFQPLQHHPGIKRAHRGATGAVERHYWRDQFLCSHQSTTQYSTLPIQILGRRVGHDVSTQQQGRLQCRRAKTIVDGQYGANVLTDLGECGNICHSIERIRRRFDKEHPGIRLGRPAPLIGISERDKTHLNAKFLQRILEQTHRGAKDIA